MLYLTPFWISPSVCVEQESFHAQVIWPLLPNNSWKHRYIFNNSYCLCSLTVSYMYILHSDYYNPTHCHLLPPQCFTPPLPFDRFFFIFLYFCLWSETHWMQPRLFVWLWVWSLNRLCSGHIPAIHQWPVV